MKFIVDAQLPRRVVRDLAAAGHDVIHTLDLPLGNRTPDSEITALAAKEGRVVVTGNISNEALSRLMTANLASMEAAFVKLDFIELNASVITIHA